jgi:hypothetical protein
MSETSRPEAELRGAIIKTIAFFDLFDWPLTASEICTNLDATPPLAEVMGVLDKETAADHSGANRAIVQQDGFYFLAGRPAIIASRQQRYNYFVRKQKIARRFARLFSLCPWVRTVYLSNVIGSYNLRDGSDIDFLIVSRPHRLWLSRLYCAGLAKVLNRRPSPRRKRNRICLSFYISADRTDWSDLRLPGGDPYFDYWRKNLVLLYNKDKHPAAAARPSAGGDFWELAAKKLQLKIMPPALRAAINNSDGVVVSDSVLKFYIRDRRREYAEKYAKKIQEVFGSVR